MSTSKWMLAIAIGCLALCVFPVTARPISPDQQQSERRPTHAERLQQEGFTADGQGLLAAATSPNITARKLAYLTAYDQQIDVLIDPAIQELDTVEDTSLWTNFAAARYLDQQGRAEGTDYLRHLASIPLEELNHSPDTLRVMDSIRILAEKGDESFAPQIISYLETAWPSEAIAAVRALAAYRNSSDPEVERAWIAATERLSAFLQAEDPQVHNGARLYATWLSDSVRKQSVVTQRIKDAFDAIVLPPDRDDEQGRIARSLESARTHWATCELVPSEEPPPAEQPADPPPADPE